jgi:hypothetical protein
VRLAKYSSTFTRLARLCSNNWRLLKRCPEARQHAGLAAASITQSAAGKGSKSLARRISPWMNFTPMRRSRTRLISEPGRWRLSMPAMERPSRRSRSASATALPANPQIPVIRIFINRLLGAVPSNSRDFPEDSPAAY